MIQGERRIAPSAARSFTWWFMRDGYDVAQVCLNGHEANASSTGLPEFNKAFCSKCGEKTIAACPGCTAPIRGYYWGSMSAGYTVPQHCHQCGTPYPWTARRKEAALELFLMTLDLKKEQQEDLRIANSITSRGHDPLGTAL